MDTQPVKAYGKPQRRLALMDYLAIVAGVINLLVIGFIVGYWFTT